MLRNILFILLLLPFLLKAQSYPAKPVNYVTDETGTLTSEQLSALNAKLKAFEDTTTNQIFVYFAESLNGQDLAQFSQELFHNWRIGQKDRNNGVLIAIFKNDHKFRIQTGYGLEGQLPDLLTKRIQDNEMRPLFKQNDYYGGIDKGVDFLMYYSRNAFDPALLQAQSQPSPAPAEFDYGKGLWGILIGYSINGLLLFFYIRQQRKKNKDRPARKAIFITIAVCLAIFPCFGSMILFFMLLGMQDTKGISSGGSYSSYSSSSDSSWSSSDSSSSDFGGGGGGDSGGGGSSSDW